MINLINRPVNDDFIHKLAAIDLMSLARQELSHITFQRIEKFTATIQVYHKFVLNLAQIFTTCSVVRQFLSDSFNSMPHDSNKGIAVWQWVGYLVVRMGKGHSL